jgi:CarD family transcriptional regulator
VTAPRTPEPSQRRGIALKNKNTGPKSAHLKIANPRAASSKTVKKIVRRSTQAAVVAVKSAATPSAKVVVQKIRAAQSSKARGSDKLATAKALKATPTLTAVKTQKSKLKLVVKPGAQVPVSKITRSEPSAIGPRVLSGPFGTEASVRTGLAVGANAVEKAVVTTTTVVEAVSFKVGDKIVYPGHGVGQIEGIRTTVLSGQEHHIYNIQILDSGMKVMVPVSQAAAVGLRRIIDKRAIDKVYDILRDRDFKIDTQTWNRRFREYSQKIKTGSVYEIAIVLRDLSVLSADKELSFGEKKMLDMAETLLVSEIAIAKARPHDKVAGELRSLFS